MQGSRASGQGLAVLSDIRPCCSDCSGAFGKDPVSLLCCFPVKRQVVRSAPSSDAVKIVEQYLERQDGVVFAKRSLNTHNKMLCVKVWCVQGVEITEG